MSLHRNASPLGDTNLIQCFARSIEKRVPDVCWRFEPQENACALHPAPAYPRRPRYGGSAAFHWQGWAQKTHTHPQGRNCAQGPADAVAARQAQQQGESRWPQQCAYLTKRQDATSHRAGAARGREAGRLRQQNGRPPAPSPPSAKPSRKKRAARSRNIMILTRADPSPPSSRVARSSP